MRISEKNNEIFKMKSYTTRSFDNKQYTNLEHLKQNSKSNKLDNESGVKKKSIIQNKEKTKIENKEKKEKIQDKQNQKNTSKSPNHK